MPSHTTPWQRSSYFASRGWSKVRNNPLNEIEQDRNTVSSVVVVQVRTSTTRFPKQLLVSLPTLKSDPVDTVVDTSNYITRVGLTWASCVIIPTAFLRHSYVIPTSFLHPSHIIPTSFIHHSNILHTSFLHPSLTCTPRRPRPTTPGPAVGERWTTLWQRNPPQIPEWPSGCC